MRTNPTSCIHIFDWHNQISCKLRTRTPSIRSDLPPTHRSHQTCISGCLTRGAAPDGRSAQENRKTRRRIGRTRGPSLGSSTNRVCSLCNDAHLGHIGAHILLAPLKEEHIRPSSIGPPTI